MKMRQQELRNQKSLSPVHKPFDFGARGNGYFDPCASLGWTCETSRVFRTEYATSFCPALLATVFVTPERFHCGKLGASYVALALEEESADILRDGEF